MISPNTDIPKLTSILLSNLKYLLNDQQYLNHPSNHYNQIPPTLNQCLQLSLKLMRQQQSTQQIMMTTYQSVTHLLDNLLFLQGIIKSNDKVLLQKALSHFHDHLIIVVQNLHQYPISSCHMKKKNSFMQRHLEIMNDFDFKNQVKHSKEVTEKEFSFYTQSKFSVIHKEKLSDESYFNTNEFCQVVEELEEAKLIIEDLNKYYEDESKILKQKILNMQRKFQEQKHKFINIIEDLEVETVKLKYQKLRDELVIDELKVELQKLSFKTHQKQLSTGQF